LRSRLNDGTLPLLLVSILSALAALALLVHLALLLMRLRGGS